MILAGAILAAGLVVAPLKPILAGRSASAVLATWCADHRLRPLRADRLERRKPADSKIRSRLAARRGDPIAYRGVRLACGRRTLSTADNWYLPRRLTPAMNRILASTRTPFGLAVESLDFQRHTLGAATDTSGRTTISAVLTDREGRPFSYVVERYERLPN